MQFFQCNLTKEFEKRPCIYAITNKITGKIYVGKTINLYSRHYTYKYKFYSNSKDINDF